MFIGQTKCSLLVAAAEQPVDQPLIMERIGAWRVDDFRIGEREVLRQVAVVTGKRSRQDRRSDEMVAWSLRLHQSGQTPAASPHPQDIMTRADDMPFSSHLFQAEKEKVTESSRVLDLADHRFHRLLTFGPGSFGG